MAGTGRTAWHTWRAGLATILLLGWAPISAQEPSSRRQALHNLAEQWQQAEAAIEAARGGDAARLGELRRQAVELQQQLVGLATGFDVARIEEPAVTEKYDPVAELMRLLRPLLRALASATEAPRKLSELQEHAEAIDARLQQAELVQRGLRRARADADASGDALVRDRLAALDAHWETVVTELRGDRLVTRGRIEALESHRTPMTEAVQEAVAGFFQRRGASLLLAGVACLSVLLLLRFAHRLSMRAMASRRLRWPVRVFDVVFQSLVGVLAASTVLLVFYVRGDFELLALAIVFLLGLGWALSRTLPLFVEQLRLLLNAGSVREGERLVVDGLPYRVDALRLHSRLVNPELQGGVLRVPLRDLVGKASRPFAGDEPWFPTRTGDWVRLGDAFGRVELQTPEQVVVAIEQTRRTFRTADFLATNPSNLSQGFQIAVTFGIDYAQQSVSTREVPERMAAALRAQLPAVDAGQHLLAVQVEFAQAGSSSLDLEARVRFDGAAAGSFGALRRAIARILVDACTQNGWNIPFPQLTVHRAP